MACVCDGGQYLSLVECVLVCGADESGSDWFGGIGLIVLVVLGFSIGEKVPGSSLHGCCIFVISFYVLCG